MATRARSSSAALAAAACALALYSAWHSGGHVWRTLGAEHAEYAQMSPLVRREAIFDEFQIPGSIFDFYATYIVPGDRIYYQVLQSGYSEDFTLPQAVEALGDFYLLPGVETTNLNDATVVVSFYANPALLHVKFITQVEAGVQPIYVSRIREP
jgi:hypothetical protein